MYMYYESSGYVQLMNVSMVLLHSHHKSTFYRADLALIIIAYSMMTCA